MTVPDAPVGSRFSTLNVLVVDDQLSVLELIADMLKSLGVAAVTTTNRPKRALEILRSDTDEGIDVVLADWRMPEVTGLDLLREVRSSRPNLPFFMVTGAADAQSVLIAKRSGVTGYIRKPFSIDELGRHLRPVAQMKSLRRRAAA